jgi:3-oxoacyl-[acyl-carrier protein] reductase
MECFGLKDKVTIITGASRGIGRAVAERFAREGAKLVLNYRADQTAMNETEAVCKEAGAEVVVHAGDIGNYDTAKALCDLALKRFGRIDVLVNNAGVVVENLLGALSAKSVQSMISTNVLGMIWTAKAVMLPMLKQRSGCIINLSSTLAKRPGAGSAVYAGTKGFIESFTQALAAEVGKRNIRVNAVAPGVIETDMSASVRKTAADIALSRIGLGRFGKPGEVAEAVAFLASDHASYINGAVLATDGAFGGGL